MFQLRLKEISLILLVSFLTFNIVGCAASYEYKSTSNTDPTIVFGDKLPDHHMDVRVLFVNTFDSCTTQFKEIGRILNYSPIVPSSRTFKVPANSTLALTGTVAENGKYGFSVPNYCSPPAIQFSPEAGHKYLVDISIENPRTSTQQCEINVQEILNDGTKQNVNSISPQQCSRQLPFQIHIDK